ncbi:MAG: hypothetical protein ACI4QT_01985 [Kiritimatiellia bacterium]
MDKNTKHLNRSVLFGGLWAAGAAFFLWIYISHRPFWTALVASAVAFVAYSCAKVDAISLVKISDYGNEDDYWKNVGKVRFIFDTTILTTTCFVLLFVLVARMI